MLTEETYTNKAVKDWCHRTMGIDGYNKQTGEVHTSCPRCSGKFYFNTKKKVGYCHSASCHWSPKLEELIKHFGFGPNQGGMVEPVESYVAPVVDLPGIPVLFFQDGQLFTSYEEAYVYLQGRELSEQIILNWGITCDGRRVYVPIRDEEGVLVNYNSRILPSVEDGNGKKYLYHPGVKTSHYILGWSEARLWSTLALVENTFVSLAYRYSLNCSTTFGSSISDEQIDLIVKSNVKTVCLLWDENANAAKYVKRLQKAGLKAAAWKILKQPDDYPFNVVEARYYNVLAAARLGHPGGDIVDYTKETQ